MPLPTTASSPPCCPEPQKTQNRHLRYKGQVRFTSSSALLSPHSSDTNSKDHGNSHHKDNWEDGQLRQGLGGQTGVKGKEEDRQGGPGPRNLRTLRARPSLRPGLTARSPTTKLRPPTVVSKLLLLYSTTDKTSTLKMKSFSTVRVTQRQLGHVGRRGGPFHPVRWSGCPRSFVCSLCGCAPLRPRRDRRPGVHL